MADRYCKYCERENDDCQQRCAGWVDTVALRNHLQVLQIKLDMQEVMPDAPAPNKAG